jgi:hypothetical protein
VKSLRDFRPQFLSFYYKPAITAVSWFGKSIRQKIPVPSKFPNPELPSALVAVHELFGVNTFYVLQLWKHLPVKRRASGGTNVKREGCRLCGGKSACPSSTRVRGGSPDPGRGRGQTFAYKTF